MGYEMTYKDVREELKKYNKRTNGQVKFISSNNDKQQHELTCKVGEMYTFTTRGDSWEHSYNDMYDYIFDLITLGYVRV